MPGFVLDTSVVPTATKQAKPIAFISLFPKPRKARTLGVLVMVLTPLRNKKTQMLTTPFVQKRAAANIQNGHTPRWPVLHSAADMPARPPPGSTRQRRPTSEPGDAGRGSCEFFTVTQKREHTHTQSERHALSVVWWLLRVRTTSWRWVRFTTISW